MNPYCMICEKEVAITNTGLCFVCKTPMVMTLPSWTKYFENYPQTERIPADEIKAIFEKSFEKKFEEYFRLSEQIVLLKDVSHSANNLGIYVCEKAIEELRQSRLKLAKIKNVPDVEIHAILAIESFLGETKEQFEIGTQMTEIPGENDGEGPTK